MPRHGCNLRNRFTDIEHARDIFMSEVVEAQVFNFQNFACPRECGADGVAVMREHQWLLPWHRQHDIHGESGRSEHRSLPTLSAGCFISLMNTLLCVWSNHFHAVLVLSSCRRVENSANPTT